MSSGRGRAARRRLAAAQIWRVASMPSSTGMRISISTMSGRCSWLCCTASSPSGCSCDDGDVGLGLEERGEACAYGLLVVGDQSADHGAAWVVGSVMSTSKPPPCAGPEEKVPPASVARSRIPISPWPSTGSPLSAPGPYRKFYAQAQGVVAIGDLDVDVGAGAWRRAFVSASWTIR